MSIGAKKVETRSWSTKYRGPLAIHASKRFTAECKYLLEEHPFFDVLCKIGLNKPVDHILGAILSICELTNCIKIDPTPPCVLTDQERAFGDYRPGRFMWILENVKKLETPIPIKGAMGLWEWEEVNHDRT